MFITRSIYIIAVLSTVLVADIKVINRETAKDLTIKTLKGEKKIYISTRDLVLALSSRLYENQERKKLVLYISGKRIKVTAGTSFLIIDDVPYQMIDIVREYDGDFYLPAESFFDILRKTTLSGLFFDKRKETLNIDIVRYNVKTLDIEQKANGTIVRIKTQKSFSDRDISSFINKHGWFYLTIVGGRVDTSTLNKTITRGIIQRIEADQINETSQIALKLRSNVISHEWYQNHDPNEIVITLRTALNNNINRLKKVKDRWKLDTIVLDAGHGGKDPGAIANGFREKDITLSIAKKIGYKLEKSLGVNVIYTRKEDIFLSLKARTEIANTNNGDIFISIHANSINNSPSTKGFETYLLRPGKTKDAIAIALRENSVIKEFESNINNYNIGSEFILATIEQNAYIKESEFLAREIQYQLSNSLKNKKLNRGIKQAGFQVLVGASMPNVLIEVGFLTNTIEAQNLSTKKYQDKIAQGIVNALIIYKNRYEQHIIE